MHRQALMKAAASSFIVAVTMVGCSGAALTRPGLASKSPSGTYATTAMAALAKQDAAKAVPAAEAAVAGEPDNAGYRALLGRAYLLDGRYSAAETSFTDAMTLGNSDARTIVSLALVQVALGKGAAAQSLLAANRDTLPAADYGLAVALAGDAQRGVEALSTAVRDPSANAKTRQNLAYAYALAGMWTEARVMAEQDLSPADAAKRVTDWALTSNPDFAPARIAMLTGVSPKPDDAGLPVRLALVAPAPDAAPVRTAEAEPTPVAQAAAAPAITSSGVQFAASSPVVQQLPHKYKQRRASYPAAIANGERVIRAPSTPMRVAATRAFLPTARNASLVQPVSGGSFVVQLGAYDSAAIAKEKFQHLARRNAAIARFPLVQTSATVNGRLFYRAAIGGFANAASAGTMCRTLRAQGSACFVRAVEGAADAPAKPKMTSSATPKQGKQLASR
jgi:Flp pilus assembly protein TadD